MDELKIGVEYLIFDEQAEKSQTSFKGYYLGRNPVETPWYFDASKPEGHVFVRRVDGRGIEIYCTRSDNLRLLWYDDGSDGPSWPAGFRVSKVDVKLSKSEKVYLESRLNVYELNKEKIAA